MPLMKCACAHLSCLIFINADGQYMASRISKAITKETRKLRRLLTEFNSNMVPSEQLEWEDVCSPTASIWFQLEQLDLPVPKPVRLSAINALMTRKRAEEEVVMLKQEMSNVLAFFVRDALAVVSVLEKQVEASEPLLPYDRGCMYLLKLRLCSIRNELFSCQTCFTGYIDVTNLAGLNFDAHTPALDRVELSKTPGVREDEEDGFDSPGPATGFALHRSSQMGSGFCGAVETNRGIFFAAVLCIVLCACVVRYR